MPTKKPNPKRFKARARRYFILRQKGKDCYAQADAIAGELGKQLGAGAVIDIGEGRCIVVIDNYAAAMANEKYANPTTWTPCASRQFELEMR